MNETVALRENLRDAMNDQSLTANGGKTLASSLNKNVDFFFLAGASRGKDIEPQFLAAFNENRDVALRILQWARDVRGGAGERETFRSLLRTLLNARASTTGRDVLQKVPEIGRWDDLLVAFGTPAEHDALQMIAKALVTDQDGLCAKWMPRKGADANKIRAYLRLTPKSYRKLLVELSNTVEQKMCARAWDKIEYGKLPSVASARYQKAFSRNDTDRYVAYLEALKKGEDKINAGAVYPYDIVKSLSNGNEDAAIEQWKALPDYLNGSDENILPVVDVSGSMHASAGNNKNLQCIDVAVSLGLYLSERNTSIFKDTFITFSGNPEMVTVSGNLAQRAHQMFRANWGMNTNIEAVFETILTAATKHNVPAEGMPSMLLILSDMEFDGCVSVGPAKKDDWSWGSNGETSSQQVVTAMEMIKQKYAAAGYKVPQIVFWNLNGRPGNVPVQYNEAGAALVSGFSPAIMTSLLGGEEMTPENIMLKTVMVDRYKI